MDPPLELGVEHHDGTTVVSVAGEIDMVTAPKLRECLLTTEGNVIVDLSAVSFFDSSGIAALVNTRNLTLRTPQRLVRQAP